MIIGRDRLIEPDPRLPPAKESDLLRHTVRRRPHREGRDAEDGFPRAENPCPSSTTRSGNIRISKGRRSI
ncbi:MAG: hypothetical protein MZV64_04045 [Ignavibacteriales bacterium]|nr:hypothetical protein [Ignavibacteriales bacterium]